MKKKGFTLVELLAVIAILAIIALIALPTINSLIKETRKKAFTDTAYGIIKAGEQYYAKKDLLEDEVVQATFNFPNATSGLELSGKLPTSGSMKIDKTGNISLAISNGRYCVKKGINDTEVTLTEDIENCNIPNPYIISTSNDCATKGKCTEEQIKTDAGVKVTVQVNDKETKDFYVLADNGTELTLIMSENLGNQVAWYKDNDDSTNNETNALGPITALSYLNEQTSYWTNIEEISSYTYGDNNYVLRIIDGIASLDGTIINGINRARLLTYEETELIGCTASVFRACPKWISNDSHWTLTTYTVLPQDHAYIVASSFESTATSLVYDVAGVRPVIQILK